jgi:hypothetical protein
MQWLPKEQPTVEGQGPGEGEDVNRVFQRGETQKRK